MELSFFIFNVSLLLNLPNTEEVFDIFRSVGYFTHKYLLSKSPTYRDLKILIINLYPSDFEESIIDYMFLPVYYFVKPTTDYSDP